MDRSRSPSWPTPDALTARLSPRRSPPRLLTAAAQGGLRPPPTGRPRRTTSPIGLAPPSPMQHRINRSDLLHRPPHAFVAHPTRLRSPKKAPVPDRPTLRSGPDGASGPHFHAPKRTCTRRAPGGCRNSVERERLGLGALIDSGSRTGNWRCGVPHARDQSESAWTDRKLQTDPWITRVALCPTSAVPSAAPDSIPARSVSRAITARAAARRSILHPQASESGCEGSSGAKRRESRRTGRRSPPPSTPARRTPTTMTAARRPAEARLRVPGIQARSVGSVVARGVADRPAHRRRSGTLGGPRR